MTRIRVSIKVVLFLFLIFGLVLSVTPTPLRAADAKPIKIGVIGSQSGWAGFIGTPQKEVILATVADINKKGGLLGRPIEVFIEDD